MMKAIQPASLSERDNYKLLVGSVIPRPIAFVTTLSEKGVLNGAPFSYFNVVTSNPPMISVSVQRKNGIQKDTARNANDRESFVVHMTDASNVEAVNDTAANVSSDESEIILAGLTPVASTQIDVPGVKEAKIRMECTLEKSIALGEDDAGCDLLIGRVVCFHIDENLHEEGRIDAAAFQPVSRLAGNNYAGIGDIFTHKRPE